MVNAYTLSFATLMIAAATLGDRLGPPPGVRRRHRRCSPLASIASALATSAEMLIAARAVQGAGAAAIMPLSLTLLAGAVPPARRAMAIGIWGGVSGLGVALGPVIGGAVVDGISWEAIFWINVPVALVAIPLVLWALPESLRPTPAARPRRPRAGRCRHPRRSSGRSSAATTTAGAPPASSAASLLGVLLLGAFLLRESRTDHPLVPLRLFRVRSFSVANASALAFSFGVFGLVFLLAQYLQIGDGLHPAAGRHPHAAVDGGTHDLRADRRACSRPGSASGRCSPPGSPCRPPAWRGRGSSSPPTASSYADLVPGLALAGIGMGLTFAPSATAVLVDMAPDDHGTASSVNATIREIGGALGVAALVAVFTASDGTLTPDGYVGGSAAGRPASPRSSSRSARSSSCVWMPREHRARTPA